MRREEDSESRGERQSERREEETGGREERSEGRYRVRDIEKREIQ